MQGLRMKFLDSIPAWTSICVPGLSVPLRDWRALSSVVHRIHEGTYEPSRAFAHARACNLEGLAFAIQLMQTHSPGFDFFGSIVPFLQSWALRLPELASSCPPVPVLVQGVSQKAVVPRNLGLSLLANSFFCANMGVPELSRLGVIGPFPTPVSAEEWGDLDWYGVYSCTEKVGVERIKCLLSFFQSCQVALEGRPDGLPGSLTFTRVCAGDTLIPTLEDNPTAIIPPVVHIGGMEDAPAEAIVDFANRTLHIGCVLPSATQEEIMFSCRTELLIGMLLCQRMADNEALLIHGAPTACHYKGYGDTFEFTGAVPSESLLDHTRAQHVVAMDATIRSHFSRDSLERDTIKALLGFSALPSEVAAISTGGWGCGAFGGDWWLKFLQQAIAGSLAGKRLQFSTFKKPALAAELSGLLSPGATVGDVWKILVSFDGSDAPSFHNHVRKSLAATK